MIAIVSAQDFPQVLALLERCELPLDGLHDHQATTLVAIADNHIVGSAALEVYHPSALLRSVAVDALWRGQGLGQQLVRVALELAQQHRVEQVYLLTETAATFFPRFGFQPVARATVDPAIHQSVEWTDACPASALVLVCHLKNV